MATQGYCTVNGSEITRTFQEIAPAGSYAWSGECYFCPSGRYVQASEASKRSRYGDQEGLWTPECSGTCSPGYYCPVGSISPTQIECGGPDKYCPGENSFPLDINKGFYTTIDASTECPPGTFRDVSTTSAQPERSIIPVNYGDALFGYASYVQD